MMRHLPAGWKMGRLADIGEVVTGTTPTKTRPDYYDGEVPFVTPRELDAAKPIRCAQTTLTHLGASKAKLLPAGSVLVSCIGSLGKVGFADVELATNQQINAVVPDTGRVDPRYLYQYCRTLRPVLEHVAPSTTLKIVKKSLFQELPIPLPPLPEQRRIAAILDKADAVRRKRQQTIDLADQFLRSAFLDLFGDPVTNPKRWPVKKLGDCLAEKPRIGTIAKAEDDGVLRVVRVGDLGQMWLPSSLHTRISLDRLNIERFRIEPGDFLLARAIGSEEHLGKASIVSERCGDREGVVVFDSHVMRLRFEESAIRCEFFWQWLKTPGGRALFMRNAGRTAVQFNINATQIARISIAVPPESLQHQFVQITRNVREMALAVGIASAESGALFDSLVQRAFRGGLSK